MSDNKKKLEDLYLKTLSGHGLMAEEQRIKFNNGIFEIMCQFHLSQYKNTCGYCDKGGSKYKSKEG